MVLTQTSPSDPGDLKSRWGATSLVTPGRHEVRGGHTLLQSRELQAPHGLTGSGGGRGGDNPVGPGGQREVCGRDDRGGEKPPGEGDWVPVGSGGHRVSLI